VIGRRGEPGQNRAVPASTPRRRTIRDALTDTSPMLLGVVPFGLVAGAAPIAAGLDPVDAVAMSVIIFGGSSQLAMTEVFRDGGGTVVMVVTAITINLRVLLYSASLAPGLAHESLLRRLGAAYFLVDQNYAMAVSRWTGDDDRRERLAYYLAVSLTLWVFWVASTVAGAAVGGSVPDDVPLDFAVPLVFLVLLVPVLERWPSLVAATVGGVGAVVAAELGASQLAVVVGGLAGIVAGTVAEQRAERIGR
jgi:4-azaleucine resistance transporter AzlC